MILLLALFPCLEEGYNKLYCLLFYAILFIRASFRILIENLRQIRAFFFVVVDYILQYRNPHIQIPRRGVIFCSLPYHTAKPM